MDAVASEEPLHHAPGTLTCFYVFDKLCLTNAKPHALAKSSQINDVWEDRLVFKDGHYSLERRPDVTVNELRRAGLVRSMEAPGEGGKFVFFKDRTFVVFQPGVIHSDMLVYFKKIDRVATWSAGFVRICPVDVSVYGASVSLDREADVFAQRDRKAIVDHLQINAHVESMEL